MNRAQQRVLEEINSWRHDFVQGNLKAFGIRQPKLEPGERFACRIVNVAASGSGEPYIRMAAAHVTDRRVFLVQNRPVPQREWRWTQIKTLRLMRGWRGVLLGADPADVILSRSDPKLATAISWLKLQGAHAYAWGCLDAWFTELATGLGSGPGTLTGD